MDGTPAVKPQVYLVGETRIIDEGLSRFLVANGVPNWTTNASSDAEKLIEALGRLCYNSFAPGINPNVSRVREGNDVYLANIIETRHGSVIEHGTTNWIFDGVSRVFTPELNRHRAGVAISERSMRFVRVRRLAAWTPTVIVESPEALEIWTETGSKMDAIYQELEQKITALFRLDDPKTPFHIKKLVTSAMRRWIPMGIPTCIGWTANFRTLRWVIEMRTAPEAEEEIRMVFEQVAEIAMARYPNLFFDFTRELVGGHFWYKPANSKV